MIDKPAWPARGPIADNGARWPELATMLAPAAVCDCQMLAVAIAEAVRPIGDRKLHPNRD